MKFVTVEPRFHRAQIGEHPDLHAAARSIGIDLTKTDHGVVSRLRSYSIAIIVYEFGLFVPVAQQRYFAIKRHLYAGNAVLYAFAPAGETIDIQEPLPIIDWFDDALHVERAIQRNAVQRPQLKVNGQVIWSWPEPRPRDIPILL